MAPLNVTAVAASLRFRRGNRDVGRTACKLFLWRHASQPGQHLIDPPLFRVAADGRQARPVRRGSRRERTETQLTPRRTLKVQAAPSRRRCIFRGQRYA